MLKRLIVNRQRRRSWWRRGRSGSWSRATLWRLRLAFGWFFLNEPVLVALKQWSTGDRLGLMRVRIPYMGIEIVLGVRVPRWRRIAKVARTPIALRESTAEWEKSQREAGFHTWLSEVDSGSSADPRKLDAVLCRALVMEVLGCQRKLGR